jgi:hypothetical protein
MPQVAFWFIFRKPMRDERHGLPAPYDEIATLCTELKGYGPKGKHHNENERKRTKRSESTHLFPGETIGPDLSREASEPCDCEARE